MSEDAVFLKELERLVNRYGWDSKLNTPDYILANFLFDSLTAFGSATNKNIHWHGWKALRENEKQPIM